MNRTMIGFWCFAVLAGASPASAVAPPGRYEIGTEVVTDTRTKLSWQRRLPATYTNCTGKYDPDAGLVGDACTLEQAKAYCAALSLGGGTGWRLPTRAEIVTVIDRSEAKPAMDPLAFPEAPADVFWTATKFIGFDNQNWNIEFSEGVQGFSEATDALKVRCVR